MKLHSTPCPHLAYGCLGDKSWSHFDVSDEKNTGAQRRVGPIYETREALLADHRRYAAEAWGWHTWADVRLEDVRKALAGIALDAGALLAEGGFETRKEMLAALEDDLVCAEVLGIRARARGVSVVAQSLEPCPTCARAPDDPYRGTIYGVIEQGCIDHSHGGPATLRLSSASRAWHDREVSRAWRRAELVRLRACMSFVSFHDVRTRGARR